MKLQHKKRDSKKPIIISCITVIVVLLVSASVYAANHGSFFGWTPFPAQAETSSPIDYGPPSDEEIDTGTDIKDGSTSGNTGTETKPGTTDQLPSDNSNTVSILIPYSGQMGTNLQVTTLIEKVTSQGTCTLTLSRSGSTSVTSTVDVQAQASASTCKGFTIPTSGLASGIWNLRIDYKNGSLTGSVSKDQQIN